MKKFLCFLAALLPIGIASADVVYLNNGNVIKGTVTAQDNYNVSIQTENGTTLQYPKVEVRSINLDTNTVDKPTEPKRPNYVDTYVKDRGWWCAAELKGGSTMFADGSDMGHVELDYIVGYRLNQWFRVGVGVGARYYIHNIDPEKRSGTTPSSWAAPVFAEFRGSLLDQYLTRWAPYWQMDVGYTFGNDAQGKNADGFFIRPTIGFKFGDLRHNFTLGVTYLGQINNTLSRGLIWNSALGLTLGYEF